MQYSIRKKDQIYLDFPETRKFLLNKCQHEKTALQGGSLYCETCGLFMPKVLSYQV